MGAVEITLVGFITLMVGLAGSCILTFVLKRMTGAALRNEAVSSEMARRD